MKIVKKHTKVKNYSWKDSGSHGWDERAVACQGGRRRRKERPWLDGRAESTSGDRLAVAGVSQASVSSWERGVWGGEKGQKSLEDARCEGNCGEARCGRDRDP